MLDEGAKELLPLALTVGDLKVRVGPLPRGQCGGCAECEATRKKSASVCAVCVSQKTPRCKNIKH